jgi:hypothetical protein
MIGQCTIAISDTELCNKLATKHVGWEEPEMRKHWHKYWICDEHYNICCLEDKRHYVECSKECSIRGE